jgi:hypothetical protein
MSSLSSRWKMSAVGERQRRQFWGKLLGVGGLISYVLDAGRARLQAATICAWASSGMTPAKMQSPSGYLRLDPALILDGRDRFTVLSSFLAR